MHMESTLFEEVVVVVYIQVIVSPLLMLCNRVISMRNAIENLEGKHKEKTIRLNQMADCLV